MDKTLLKQLIAFTILILVGLSAHLIIHHLLYPPLISQTPSVDVVLRGKIDPNLNQEAIALMRQRRTMTSEELESFPIYLEDSEEMAKQRGQGFFLRLHEPRTPYDLDYNLFSSLITAP